MVLNSSRWQADLKKKISMREAAVEAAGLGYAGLPLVRKFLNNNFCVLGFDIDAKKIPALKRKENS